MIRASICNGEQVAGFKDKRTDIESADLMLIARVLLPEDIKEGNLLKYEMLE